MEIFYDGSKGRETMTIAKATDFYPTVAKKIARQEQGKELFVNAGIDDEHYVSYDVGIRSGTMNITPDYDNMPDEYKPKRRRDRYLTCIDRDKNAYKYYYMQWHRGSADGMWTATYGRCGADDGDRFGKRSFDWENSLWDAKFYEKEKKGYIDVSRYVLAKDDTDLKDRVVKEREKTPNSELFDLLHGAAKDAVQREINVPVNQTLLKKSRETIDELRTEADAGDLDAFNKTLMFLLQIMQRKISYGDGQGVERMLAHDDSDFGRIIQREKDLCEAMEGALTGRGTTNGDFSDYGIEVYDASPDQVEFVLRRLGEDMRKRVVRIFRVIPRKQKRKFEAYLKQRHIDKVKCFWHGSRNENWASIIEHGLKLNPDAVITGKMFGKGIYFAPSAAKSWGYTSFYGSRWANGSSGMAFMGLYATAYGRPYDVNVWDGTDYRKIVRGSSYDCVHAHANQGFLYNDEIVFYDEAAVLPEYIVQFH